MHDARVRADKMLSYLMSSERADLDCRLICNSEREADIKVVMRLCVDTMSEGRLRSPRPSLTIT